MRFRKRSIEPNKNPAANDLLVEAVRDREVDRVQRIIQAGEAYVRVEITTKDPKTSCMQKDNLLTIAASGGDAQMTRYLAPFFNQKQIVKAFEIAVTKGHLAVVESLSDLVTNIGIKNIEFWQRALVNGSDELASFLINRFADEKQPLVNIAMRSMKIKYYNSIPYDSKDPFTRANLLLDSAGREVFFAALKESTADLIVGVEAKYLDHLKTRYGDEFMTVINDYRSEDGQTLLDKCFSNSPIPVETTKWLLDNAAPEVLTKSKLIKDPGFTSEQYQSSIANLLTHYPDPFAFIQRAWGDTENPDGMKNFVSLLSQGARVQVLKALLETVGDRDHYRLKGQTAWDLGSLTLSGLDGDVLKSNSNEGRDRKDVIDFLCSRRGSNEVRLEYLMKVDPGFRITRRTPLYGLSDRGVEYRINAIYDKAESLTGSGHPEGALTLINMLSDEFPTDRITIENARVLIDKAVELKKTQHDIDSLKKKIKYKDLLLMDDLNTRFDPVAKVSASAIKLIIKLIGESERSVHGWSSVKVSQEEFSQVEAYINTTYKKGSTETPEQGPELVEYAHVVLANIEKQVQS